MVNPEIALMRRALDLASRGDVSPNPMVGCVITNNEGAIIGEGWHKVYGGPHAEIDALASVTDQEELKGATVYVTLEPCAHFGKTPPCANALAALPIKRVVVACQDPNPLVAGKGVEILEKAGIETEVGLCEKEAKAINKAFFWRIVNKRPYVTLKWAETRDGFVARKNYESKWITGSLSRTFVHKLRTDVDAVLIGGATAYYDNPRLDVRQWVGKNPVRIVIATQHSMPVSHHVLDGSVKTYLAWMGKGSPSIWPNVEVFDASNVSEPKEQMGLLLDFLAQKNIQHLLVEGGAKLLTELINYGFWNDAYVAQNPNINFKEGIGAPIITSKPTDSFMLGEDKWSYYSNDL